MASSLNLVPLPEELMARYRREGLLVTHSLSRVLARVAEPWPWLPAVKQGDRQLSYGDVGRLVQRAAAYLREAGVRQGDVVCWQVPNWWESYIVALAIWQLGAVSAPIAPIYREHELRQILDQLAPSAVIAAGSHRSSNNAEVLADLVADLNIPLAARIVVRGSQPGWVDFETVMTHSGFLAPVDTDAEAPAAVLYTSGTSSAPKGVILTARAMLADCACVIRTWGLGWSDAGYMPATMGHVTGLLLGVLTPAMCGAQTVLADGWEPGQAAREMAASNVTFSGGATVFLRELTEAVREQGGAPLSIKHYTCGGAAVPPEVMTAAEELGIPAFRCYGMTENSSVTFGNRTYPFETRALTDGPVAQGVDVKIVDLDGRALESGQDGEILVRGPERMSGYVDASANKDALDAEGWFHTGDVGRLSQDRFLTVTGRLKEIINRGGEKFSALEIEDLLRRHRSVRDAAVVGAPDARFGEVPAAFVVAEESIAVDDISALLADLGLAKQKIPVHWRFVSALPVTASGKIKKSELVQRLAAEIHRP